VPLAFRKSSFCLLETALPKSLQARAKADLHEIWMAPTRAHAIVAFDHFLT
jgi:hypothetical protein